MYAPVITGLRTLTALMTAGETPRLSILIYHRVLPEPDALATWDPTAAQFDRQMRILAACFKPMALGEAISRLQQRTLPSRALAVTFDDGYADNVATALPILVRHNIRATFFIATGYLDGRTMWNDRVVEAIRSCNSDDFDGGALGLGRLALASVELRRKAIAALLAALKHLPPAEREARTDEIETRAGSRVRKPLMMSDRDVRTLRGAGMEIGAHTVTHPILARLSEDEARREIVASRDDLGTILGEPVTLFAYPNGKPGSDYGPEHVRIVEQAGFRAAVSTAAGAADASADVLQLPRFTPWQRDALRFCGALLANRRKLAPSKVAPRAST